MWELFFFKDNVWVFWAWILCGCFVQKIDMSKICGVSIKIISFGFLHIENKECKKILTVTHVQNAAF